MFCSKCGSTVQGAFCSQCGAPAQATPPIPLPPIAAPVYVHPHHPRVQRNLQTLGIVWCVYGAYRAVLVIMIALILLGVSTPAFLGGMGPHAEPMLPFAAVMGGLAAVAGVFILFNSCLSFLTGYALLTHKPWGRVLAIVAAILSLIEIPAGTAVGVYTLWVLGPHASSVEYEALAHHE
jgi:Na+/H+ antiporter NhaA